jgi:hypothetical protein
MKVVMKRIQGCPESRDRNVEASATKTADRKLAVMADELDTHRNS